VSWGEGGASTPRLLSHVCRRGGLESNQVGAIRVFAESSTVEVGSDVADAFEARAARPDERDPGITITRAGAGPDCRGRGRRDHSARPGGPAPPAGERPDFGPRQSAKPFKAGPAATRSGPRSAAPGRCPRAVRENGDSAESTERKPAPSTAKRAPECPSRSPSSPGTPFESPEGRTGSPPSKR
jgi:ATP-dependent RNA helicase DeaD